MFLSWHNFKIKRLNGEIIDLYEAGLLVLGLDFPAPEETLYTEDLEGLDGHIDLGVTLKGRTGSARIFTEGRDHISFSMKTDRIYRIFDSREPFYLIRDSQPNKELLVRKSGGFSPSLEPGFMGEFTVDFISNSPYWQSIGSTKDAFTTDSGEWAFSMGLDTSKDYQYIFAANSFIVVNPGDAAIDPREINRGLVVEYEGESSNLKIENKTTGDIWSYTGSTARNEKIILDGVQTFKNSNSPGNSIFINTNHAAITLKPGDNDILITGAIGAFKISFDFKFYYL